MAERQKRITIGRARALIRYFRDPTASIFGKLFVLFAVVYVVSPIDLIPDVPIVGWLDDIGVAGLAMAFLGRVVARYRAGEEADGARGASGPRLRPRAEMPASIPA